VLSSPGSAGGPLICRLDELVAQNADQTILLVKVVEHEYQKCANPTSQIRSRIVKSDYLLYTPLGLTSRWYLCPTSSTSEANQDVHAVPLRSTSNFASPGFPVNQVAILIRVRHSHLSLRHNPLLAYSYSVAFQYPSWSHTRPLESQAI
jgi:hypothetical protein